MTRIQMACSCLLASAFVLGALVLVQGSRYVESQAHAAMVVNKDPLTLLSARATPDQEVVYVLDSKQERLLVYQVDPNRKTIELLPNGVLDMGKAFEAAAKAAPKAPVKKR
jgi:hypothetical protein